MAKMKTTTPDELVLHVMGADVLSALISKGYTDIAVEGDTVTLTLGNRFIRYRMDHEDITTLRAQLETDKMLKLTLTRLT